MNEVTVIAFKSKDARERQDFELQAGTGKATTQEQLKEVVQSLISGKKPVSYYLTEEGKLRRITVDYAKMILPSEDDLVLA